MTTDHYEIRGNDVRIISDHSDADACTYWHLRINGQNPAGHAFVSRAEAEAFAQNWCEQHPRWPD
jgi:hypothetical protein